MVTPVVRIPSVNQNSAEVSDGEDLDSRVSTIASPRIASNGAMPTTSPRNLAASVKHPEVDDPEEDEEDDDEEGVRGKNDVFEDDISSNPVIAFIQKRIQERYRDPNSGTLSQDTLQLTAAVFGFFPALMCLSVCIGLVSIAGYFAVKGEMAVAGS